MNAVSLSGSKRKSVGKQDAGKLRSEGRVPAVIYGGDEQKHIHLDIVEMEKFLYSANVYQYELDVEGEKLKCIIQEVQWHPVTDHLVHVDFLQLFDDKPVRLKLPVRTTGNSPGVRNGGRLLLNFRRLKSRALPKDMPQYIEVDISNLKIGDYIRVGDVEIPGVEFLHNPKNVIVAVKTSRIAIEDELDEEEEGEEGAEGAEGGEGDSGSEGGEDKKEEASAE